MSIYENVDSHGEIQDGKKPDEISMYTIRKAELLTEALKTGILGSFAKDPGLFISFIEGELKKLWDSGKSLSAYAKLHADKIRKITKFKGRISNANKDRFEQALIFIKDLNPSGITYKEKTDARSADAALDTTIFCDYYNTRYPTICWSTHGSSVIELRGRDAQHFSNICSLALADIIRFSLSATQLALEHMECWDETAEREIRRFVENLKQIDGEPLIIVT